MKIRVSNLGKIKHTELDLKPLTVIIGPNNSNKTYLAYSIYALWHQAGGSWGRSSTGRVPLARPVATGWNITSLNAFSCEIALDERFYDYFIKAGQMIASSLNTDTLRQFFQDETGQLFKRTKIEVEVEQDDLHPCLERLIENPLPLRVDESLGELHFSLSPISLVVEWKNVREETEILEILDVLKTSIASGDFSENKLRTPPSLLLEIVDQRVSQRLLRYLFFDALAFPAERTALVTTYKALQNQRFRSFRDASRRTLKSLQGQQKLPSFEDEEKESSPKEVRFSQPVEDFLDFMTGADSWRPRRAVGSSKFSRLADLVERSMHGDNKAILHRRGDSSDIRIRTGDIEMDLWNASSSVKQLVPLMLYLRYVAEKGDFLIIDEPEMNLHPLGQAQLLEVLAALVNAGVRILVTTHSPYIMTHLNTLISGKIGHPRTLNKQAKKLYLQESASFLRPQDVSAYEMKNSELVSLLDYDYGIRWDTLSDVSSELREKYLDVTE